MDTGSGPEGSALYHTGENYNIMGVWADCFIQRVERADLLGIVGQG